MVLSHTNIFFVTHLVCWDLDTLVVTPVKPTFTGVEVVTSVNSRYPNWIRTGKKNGSVNLYSVCLLEYQWTFKTDRRVQD